MFVFRAVLSRFGLRLPCHASGLASVGLVSGWLYRALVRRLIGAFDRLFLFREIDVLGMFGRLKQGAKGSARVGFLAFDRHVASLRHSIVQRAGSVSHPDLICYYFALYRGLDKEEGARHLIVACVVVEDVAKGFTQAGFAGYGA